MAEFASRSNKRIVNCFHIDQATVAYKEYIPVIIVHLKLDAMSSSRSTTQHALAVRSIRHRSGYTIAEQSSNLIARKVSL